MIPDAERRPGVAGDRPHRICARASTAWPYWSKRRSSAIRTTMAICLVFRGRRGGLIKVLWHDGQGMCVFAKRLERGHFVWPSTSPRGEADRTVTITPAQLGSLLEGNRARRLPQHNAACFLASCRLMRS